LIIKYIAKLYEFFKIAKRWLVFLLTMLCLFLTKISCGVKDLLKNEMTTKCGIKAKRLKAGWDNKYLPKILKI
jgi:hypothetical protein